MSFELSPLYRHSNSTLSQFSTSSDLHLTAHNDIIILRDVNSTTILKTYSIPNPSTTTNSITTLLFSPAPPFLILAHVAKSSIIYLFHPQEDAMVGKILIGEEGCSGLCWSANGESIMIWNQLNTKITIHRVDGSSLPLVITAPKLAFSAGYSFRPSDSNYLAVVERNQARDHIAIYDAKEWKLLRSFPAPSTADIAGIKWSPCGKYITIWESILDYILYIYAPDGRLLSTFAPYSSISPAVQATTTRPTVLKFKSKSLHKVEAVDLLGVKEELIRAREEKSTENFVGFGIRKVEWSEDGNYLAIGGWDGIIRVLTKNSWTIVTELKSPDKITSSKIKVWREPTDWLEKSRGYGIVSFEAQELPYNSPSVRAEKVVNPKMGIAELSWSASGRWIASFNQTYPTTIWIYSFPSSVADSDKLPARPYLHSVLILSSPIKSFQWSSIPSLIPEELSNSVDDHFKDILLIATGVQSFTTWTEPRIDDKTDKVHAEGVAITIPSKINFSLRSIKFSNDGKSILLSDSDTFLLAYPI